MAKSSLSKLDSFHQQITIQQQLLRGIATLPREHVCRRKPVGLFLDPGFVALGADLVLQLDEVVLDAQIQQPLGGLLRQAVIP